jgi:hypothetical protein
VILSALGGGPAWGAARAPSLLAVGPVGSVMMWLGVLLVCVLVGGFVLLFLRRWLLDAGADEGAAGWDLRALRLMRDRGEISEGEYELARSRIIEAFSKSSPSTPTPSAAVSPPRSGGELRAEPGFDLTGEPLPDFSGGENAASGESEGPKN